MDPSKQWNLILFSKNELSGRESYIMELDFALAKRIAQVNTLSAKYCFGHLSVCNKQPLDNIFKMNAI